MRARSRDEERLRDKVIVITGASSGFGRGAALAFALDPTKDETIVGAAGKASVATARLSRAAAEAMISRAHEKQMKAPSAPPNGGGLTRPTPVGTGVIGGWKEKEKEKRVEKKTRRRSSPRGGRPEV